MGITDDCPVTDCDLLVTCFGRDCIDGELSEFCKLAGADACASCYPYSTCGSALEVDDESKMLVPNPTTCGPDVAAECDIAAVCFEHSKGQCDFLGELMH